MSLTVKQAEVMRIIVSHTQEHGRPPTLQYVADQMGITKITVHQHVRELVKKGHLEELGVHHSANRYGVANSLHTRLTTLGKRIMHKLSQSERAELQRLINRLASLPPDTNMAE